METAKIVGLLVGASVLALMAIFLYPFLVAIGIKWMTWLAVKSGVDSQLLIYCCYLFGIQQAIQAKTKGVSNGK